jgi:hypothetical protein
MGAKSHQAQHPQAVRSHPHHAKSADELRSLTFVRVFYETINCHTTLRQSVHPLLKHAFQCGFFNELKNHINRLQKLIGLLE